MTYFQNLEMDERSNILCHMFYFHCTLKLVYVEEVVVVVIVWYLDFITTYAISANHH